MENGLFRQKTLDKMSSPEQMNDYIRVTNPGVWLVLGAVVALLAGLIIWAAAGRLETTVPGALAAGPDGSMVLYIPNEKIGSVEAGQTVRMWEQEYTLSAVASRPVAAQSVLEDYALGNAGLTGAQWLWPAEVTGGIVLPEGVYSAEIVTDSVSPISFLLN